MKEKMEIIDDYGISHELTINQVTTMIIIGWVTFFLAWIITLAFYKVT